MATVSLKLVSTAQENMQHHQTLACISPYKSILVAVGYVIVISWYECDIRVMAQDRGEAEVAGDDRISHE